MRERELFNLELYNLFIGLAKGHRYLKPYSQEFKKMDFKVHSIEFRFQNSDISKITPELILISEKIRETLIFEWTQQSLNETKKKQLQDYNKTKKEYLIDYAFIPEKAAENFDFLIIVNKHNYEEYKEYLKKVGIDFPLFIYYFLSKKQLEKILNKFKVEEVEQFFSQNLNFSRIPISYITFDINNLSHENIVGEVIHTLLEILSSYEEGEEFTIEELCEMMLRGIWRVLSAEKRRVILRKAKEIINELIKRKHGSEILERVRSDPPTWKIILKKEDRLNKFQIVKKRMEEFKLLKEGKGVQTELFGEHETQ